MILKRLQMAMLIAIVLILAQAAFLPGQRTLLAQQPTPEKPIPIEPQTQRFKDATAKFREHSKAMREVAVRFNVGGSGEERKWKEKWLEMQAEGLPMYIEVLHAGAAEYASDPEKHPDLRKWLAKVVRKDVDADRFEGRLELVQALLKGDPDNDDLHRYLGMTAIALNEHEAARASINRLVEAGNASEQLVQLRDEIDRLVDHWQEELEIRKKDAEGEALPKVLIRTTKGDMEVELFENQAPETVANFISLAESGFYERRPFHIGKQHFLIQGGGDDLDVPEYNIYSEAKRPDARRFYRGTLGLALSGDENTGYSQFFITMLPNRELYGTYTAFGRITKGMDILANLVKIDPDEKKDDKGGPPKAEPDEILEIQILQKRDHPYEPNKVQ